MRPKFLLSTGLSWCCAALPLGGGGACAATVAVDKQAKAMSAFAAPALPPIPRSVFEVPTIPEQGRDPFFPQSTRLFAGKRSSTNSLPAARVALSLRGLAGAPGQRLATIQVSEQPPRHVILGQGEERLIRAQGRELRIRCVQITDGHVLLEVNGVQQELHLRHGS